MIVMLALALGPAPALAKPRWQELPLPPAMPSPTASGHVEIAGAQIYYASFGQGDPVILLHGGLGNGDHFAFQVPELAQKFRVIVIDSRHQGRSTFGKTQLTYHAMAADVIAVMDKLKLASAAIVGWSDGGEIGLDLAIVNPDRVTKLFILGANYDSNGSKPRGRPTSTFTAYTAKCRADYLRLSKSPKAYNAVIDSLLPVWRGKSGFTKEKLRAIKAPTVIADGDHDEIIELAQIKEMAQLIPNARLVVFENTSHFALWQDPAAFNKALLEFLSTP
ncbi:MAG: putative alpha/beta hydrolase [Deltaproteobacteria bacterium]|nr:putative alpha/beta hydrolase [Deltaproteobacteria bacterium]